MRKAVGTALVTLIAVGSTHASVVLCAKPRGDGSFSTTVKIRTGACRANEQQLDPGPLGLQGPKGDPGSVGPQGVVGPALVVRDTAGVLVGSVLVSGTGDRGTRSIVIARKVPGGSAAAFTVKAAGFEEQTAISLFFEDSSCSGTPLVPAIESDLLPLATVVGGVAYFADGVASTKLLGAVLLAPYVGGMASCVESGGQFLPPSSCCFAYSSVSTDVLAAASMLDVTALGLVPPFRVEVP